MAGTRRSSAAPRLLALMCLMALVAGCRKPLFPNRSARTQFEAYDRQQRRVEPATEFDEFNNRQPNLAGRLLRED